MAPMAKRIAEIGETRLNQAHDGGERLHVTNSVVDLTFNTGPTVRRKEESMEDQLLARKAGALVFATCTVLRDTAVQSNE